MNALQFLDRARRSGCRQPDDALVGDTTYLWWALGEIRTLTTESLEVLDCSPWGDGLFASLMAMRMKPCEASYLYKKKWQPKAEALAKLCGTDCEISPILNGKVPTHNPYDAVIIDTFESASGFASAARNLRLVLANGMWRFTRIFIRHGKASRQLEDVYRAMRATMEWSVIPQTSIVHGHMSEAWKEIIEPPS